MNLTIDAIIILATRSQEPLSGGTILLEDKGSTDRANLVIESSRKCYTAEYIPPSPTRNVSGTKSKASAKAKPAQVADSASFPGDAVASKTVTD